MYTKCKVVREARLKWGKMIGCKLSDDWATTLLTFPPVDNPAVAPGILGFNWAVWSERSEYLPTLGFVPEEGISVRRLLLRAGARMPVEKENRGARAEKRVAEFARNPPDNAWNYYTDGSALGNPGPCGGGYVVRGPNAKKFTEATFPEGHGDNNKGEMAGIKGGLLHIKKGIRDGTVTPGKEIFIFSDSALCIGYLDRGWHFDNWKKLAQETRALLRDLRKKTKIVFHWIRGHSKIPGNELADSAAKKAARQARYALCEREVPPGDEYNDEDHLAGPRMQEAATLPAGVGDVT